MKYTNREVTSMFEGLALVRRSGITFPAKIAYAIVRNFRIIDPFYQDIMDARNKIIRDNSEEGTGDEYYRIKFCCSTKTHLYFI